MCLKRTLRANEVVIRMYPFVRRRVLPAIVAGYGQACRNTMARRIEDLNRKLPHWPQIVPLFGNDLGLATAWRLLRPERSVATSVRDEGDLGSVRRPPGIDIIKVSIRKRKWVATTCRHDPKLVPLLAQV